MLSWIFAGVMLPVIVGSVAAALVIAVPWDSLSEFFEPMFWLWGEIMTG